MSYRDARQEPFMEDMVYGKIDLTLDENIYFTMQERLVGYFMMKPEAEECHVTPEVLSTIHRKGRRRLRSGSKLAGHESVNIEWRDWDSGEVFGQEEVKIPSGIQSRLSELAERSRQRVKMAKELANGNGKGFKSRSTPSTGSKTSQE